MIPCGADYSDKKLIFQITFSTGAQSREMEKVIKNCN